MQGLLVNESMTVMQNKITEPSSIDSGTHPDITECQLENYGTFE